MARQVLPIVGAIVGSFFGAPQLGFAIGSIIGNAIDPQVIKGPRLGEAGLQTSAEGVFRPVVLGTGAVKGNIIERGNRVVQKKRQQQGKGGGPVTEEERVYWTFAIRLCEGPIVAVTRIWQDEKLVYDIRPESTITAESAEFSGKFRLYLGDESQLPDPDIETYRGMGNVPSYRGTAYVVFPNFDLTDYRERIPDFRFEVTTSVAADPPNNALASRRNSGSAEVSFTPDGSTWSAWGAVSGFDPVRIIGTRDRFISYASTGTYNWTDNNGSTWMASTGIGPGGSSGPHVGQCSLDGQTIMVARGVNSPVISRDNGSSFQLSGASRQLDSLNPVNNRWVGWWAGRFYYTNDEGISFNTGALTPQFNTLVCAWSSFERVKIGGFGNGAPRVFTTDDGDLASEDSLPGFFTASRVTALAYDADNSVWALGTDSNQLAFNDGTGWAISTTLFPSGYVCDAMTHNGDVFIALMREAGLGPRTAITATSVDGSVWTTVRTESINNSTTLNVASLVDPPDVVDVGDTTLAAIVTELHSRAGQSAARYDVSELDDVVAGLVLAGDYTCADGIRTLMPPYFFDAAEYDDGTGYRIHYIKRGKAAVGIVTDVDLIDYPDRSTREDPQERPKVLHLHYENPDVGYVPAKATSRRDSTDVLVVGEVSLSVPVAFADVDEPARVADKLLRVAWAEVGGEEEFIAHDGLLQFVPTDCIVVQLRGQSRRLRIVQDQIEAGCMRWRMRVDRQSAYTSNVQGVPVPAPTPPPPSIVGPTMYAFLDIPALVDGDDQLSWYEGASGQTEAWWGALTQRKVLANTEFEDSSTFTQNTIMGTLVADVPAASEHYTDTTNVVAVQLFTDDAIESLSDAQFLSEGGAFALEKSDGSWEVMQYRDSSDQGGGLFLLSHLARGRLNSGATSHTAGAGFVLLDFVEKVQVGSAIIGTNVTTRAISFGQSPDTATQEVHPFIGRSQIEFPVAEILLELNGSTLEARVVPRHRFGTEVAPIRSLNWSGYRWVVTDGTNTINLDASEEVRSFDVTGWSSPITVTVSQLNRITGPGPSVSEQIE